MEAPADVLERRYGDVFLSKSKNLKIASGETPSQTGREVAVYNALLDTGSVNPVIILAVVDSRETRPQAALRDLDWSSLHVRSYNSWDEVARAGITLADNEPQKPVSGALRDTKDIAMRSVSETKNSKTYHFEQASHGRVTVFTSKPVIATGGNDLPRKTSFLPWLAEANFVFERKP